MGSEGSVRAGPERAVPAIEDHGGAVADDDRRRQPRPELDGRYGSFGVGTNGALAAHWVIFDTFVGGEAIAP